MKVPEAAKPVDGISLLPLIRGEMEKRPEPIAFEKRSLNGRPRVAALVGDRYKLRLEGLKRKKPKASLYDLMADPKEQKDIASKKPEVVQRMREHLQAWRASVESDFKQYPTK